MPVRAVVPRAKGAVGDESDLVRLAHAEHVPPAAVAEVESVLHGADVGHGSGDGELLERDIGDADVADLALVLKILERADRLREWDRWVGGVQLVEIDAVELEPAQRCLAGGPEMHGAAVGDPTGELAALRQAVGPLRS